VQIFRINIVQNLAHKIHENQKQFNESTKKYVAGQPPLTQIVQSSNIRSSAV